ncbi:MAG: hypothetical protein CM1200mP16_04860 [Nitrospina sp.]|nr:MAG: hypothetical protein CM1200mP16_04860 [Nitrospina sp.]
MTKKISFLIFYWVFLHVFLFHCEWICSRKKSVHFMKHPGNYRDEINLLKEEFADRFGYELIDLEHEWRPWEIKKLSIAFSKSSGKHF